MGKPFNPEETSPAATGPLYVDRALLGRLNEHFNHNSQRLVVWLLFGMIALWFVVAALAVTFSRPAHARDLDGRYASSPLKPWFDSLKDKNGGGCCADADGAVVKDVDWSIQGEGQQCRRTPALSFSNQDVKYEGHYCVRYQGAWWLVPDSAVVDGPNKAGQAIIWPICTSPRHISGADTCKDDDASLLFIRCFIAGAQT